MITSAIPVRTFHRHDVEVAARFDALEARFKPDLATDDVRLTGLLAAMGPCAGLRVLDLGCGKGRFATPLARGGAEVVGIDLSRAMLAHATEIFRARASAQELPFADGTFDAVVAVEVIEHVEDVGAVLGEARRVLRPGGRLICIDKNVWSIDARRPWLPSLMLKWIDQRRGYWMYPSDSPVRERWFRPRQLRDAIARVGFTRSRYHFLLSRPERGRWLHRSFPATRLMTVWVGEVEGPRPIQPPEGTI